MNHTYIPQPPSPNAASVLETCCKCGQLRRRFLDFGTLYYRQLDGTWNYRRPGPCSRELQRQRLAVEINRLVNFHEYNPHPCPAQKAIG